MTHGRHSLGDRHDGVVKEGENEKRGERGSGGNNHSNNDVIRLDGRKDQNDKIHKERGGEGSERLSSILSRMLPQQPYRSSPVSSEGLRNPPLAAALVSLLHWSIFIFCTVGLFLSLPLLSYRSLYYSSSPSLLLFILLLPLVLFFFFFFSFCCTVYFSSSSPSVQILFFNKSVFHINMSPPHLILSSAEIYCNVTHCTVLYCIVLYCIVLYCIVLYCIVLYCIVLYCIV